MGSAPAPRAPRCLSPAARRRAGLGGACGAGWGPHDPVPTPLSLPSYKGLVAEALRQLVGEECYRQDEVLPPGYCTGSCRPGWLLGGAAVLCLWGFLGAEPAPLLLAAPPSTAWASWGSLGPGAGTGQVHRRGADPVLSPQTSCCGSTARARCCPSPASLQLPRLLLPPPRPPPPPSPCAPACWPSPRTCRTLPRSPRRRQAAPRPPGRTTWRGASSPRSARRRGGPATSPPRTITAA